MRFLKSRLKLSPEGILLLQKISKNKTISLAIIGFKDLLFFAGKIKRLEPNLGMI